MTNTTTIGRREAARLPIREPISVLTNAGTILVLPKDARGRWGTKCARHGTVEAWDSDVECLFAIACPADWCPGCADSEPPDTAA